MHYVSLQALQLYNSYRSHQDDHKMSNPFFQRFGCIYLNNMGLPFLNILYIAWLSLYLAISLNSSRQSLQKLHVRAAPSTQSCIVWALFPHGQGKPRATIRGGRTERVHCAVLKLISNTICERSTWILRFINALLAYTILGIELCVQVSGYIEQFCKLTEQIDLNAIQN